ncbi:cupin domain-containing protein [Deinococcus maricopensis]|uniref:Cupin 2 conserved barrel domain protein n=1 Tax=Deinococcus maricopensis (strain DSM 21211 / LMG 22137 / NRRL B-23946 / LB-34) TaxID=709986 RepID=E8UA11_DEIML|nr:cupin domain-containing protein [Deinococcus maricopensis]ADV67900.1 Cupin 2 conserved barrel domain protein [Deinococcus maricopensis DSM 21211]
MATERFAFPDDERTPNNPIPARVYRAALPADANAQAQHFAGHGWTNSWQDGVHPYDHFHTTAHEVLGVARGEATLTLGGERGTSVTVRAGDVIVLPAGTGHKNDGSSEDFLVVGAYAHGLEWDTCRPGDLDLHEARARIQAVPTPDLDPVSGLPWADTE